MKRSAEVDPSKVALLIVDMQNSFCHPDGVAVGLGGPLADIETVMSNLDMCRDAAREASITVAYTRQGYAPDYSDQGRSAAAYPISAALRAHGGVIRGTWDHAIVDALTPRDEDIVVDKTRLDAFLYTPMEAILRNAGIETLIIGGCVTNFCVETTVRSAWQRDYDVIVLEDGVAAYTPEMQARSLTTIAECAFAVVEPWHSALDRALASDAE